MRFGASTVNFNLDIPVSYVLRCCDWVRAPDRLSSINSVRLQATGVLLSAGVTRTYGGRKCYFIITDGVSILSIFREYHRREENVPLFFFRLPDKPVTPPDQHNHNPNILAVPTPRAPPPGATPSSQHHRLGRRPQRPLRFRRCSRRGPCYRWECERGGRCVSW